MIHDIVYQYISFFSVVEVEVMVGLHCMTKSVFSDNSDHWPKSIKRTIECFPFLDIMEYRTGDTPR